MRLRETSEAKHTIAMSSWRGYNRAALMMQKRYRIVHARLQVRRMGERLAREDAARRAESDERACMQAEERLVRDVIEDLALQNAKRHEADVLLQATAAMGHVKWGGSSSSSSPSGAGSPTKFNVERTQDEKQQQKKKKKQQKQKQKHRKAKGKARAASGDGSEGGVDVAGKDEVMDEVKRAMREEERVLRRSRRSQGLPEDDQEEDDGGGAGGWDEEEEEEEDEDEDEDEEREQHAAAMMLQVP